ncbi:uncharacterized protein LOC142324506 [Lycorma delicatula]|uniref:uncharacterized protein LOC142324506 n=1 Tax=Lycorma delicatula TaxID=130591 RepID=UPI003F511160
MVSTEVEEHQNPAVRVCEVLRGTEGGSCGFHLTRTKWDPYPWVSGVDKNSAAHQAGLQVGDCVLEVNGEDILGLRVSDIAIRVKSNAERVNMLLWNSGVDPNCDPESLCCGPMPTSLQRLATCVGSILAGLECPVCMDTIAPPAHQCSNGHLICAKCRILTERCPVCRLRYSRGRCLLADQIYNSLTDAFQLCGEPADILSTKIKQKLFGKKKMPEKRLPVIEIKNSYLSPRNKLLTRIMGKSSSVENLTSASKNQSQSKNYLTVDHVGFSSNLKTKSLSSNEIFRPNSSPVISRNPSVTLSNNDFSSFRSYQGSTESLSQRLFADFGEGAVHLDDGCFYHCPCAENCKVLLKKPDVFSHIRENHEGPIVQYFRPQLVLNHPLNLPEDGVITILSGGMTFFLKLIKEESDDLYMWMWILNGKSKAESLRYILTIRSDDQEGPEFNFKSRIFSLASTPWSEITSTRRGILITSQTIKAHFPHEKVKFEVNIMIDESIPVLV